MTALNNVDPKAVPPRNKMPTRILKPESSETPKAPRPQRPYILPPLPSSPEVQIHMSLKPKPEATLMPYKTCFLSSSAEAHGTLKTHEVRLNTFNPDGSLMNWTRYWRFRSIASSKKQLLNPLTGSFKGLPDTGSFKGFLYGGLWKLLVLWSGRLWLSGRDYRTL